MTDKAVRIVVSGDGSSATKTFAELQKAYKDSRAAADEMRLRLAAAREEMQRLERTAGRNSEEYRKARAEVRALSKDLGEADRFSKGFEKSLGAGKDSAAGMTAAMNPLAAGIKSVLGVAAGAASLHGFISILGESDRLGASLKTVTGSTEQAVSAMLMLRRFATETPYELDQVVEAFIRLRSLGLDASEKSLRSYGNTAAAMGKPIMQFIEAVADASTNEFERLKEFGIKSAKQGEYVTFTFQGVSTKVKANAAEIQNYLLSIGNTKFATGMQDQMKTVDGTLSNLKDSFNTLVVTVGNLGIKKALTDTFTDIASFLNQVKELVDEFTGRDVGLEVAKAKDAVAAIQREIEAVQALTQAQGGRGSRRLNILNQELAEAESKLRRLESLLESTPKLEQPAQPAAPSTKSEAEQAKELQDQLEKLKAKYDEIRRQRQAIHEEAQAEFAAEEARNTTAGQAQDLERRRRLEKQMMAREAIKTDIAEHEEQIKLVKDAGDRAKLQTELNGLHAQLASLYKQAGLEADAFTTKAAKAAEAQSRALQAELPSVFDVANARRVTPEEDPNAYLNRRAQLLQGTQAGKAVALERANQEARDAFNEGLLSQSELDDVLKQNRQSIMDSTDAAKDLGLVLSSAAGNAITNWQGFGNLLKSLGQDVAQLILKMAVLKPLEESFSSGGAASTALKAAGSAIISAIGLHSGGMVGSEATFTRTVNLAAFKNAPRFHSGGIAGDEVPIIARRGEGVFTENQMAALGAGMVGGKVIMNIYDQAGVEKETRQRQDMDGNTIIDMYIKRTVKTMISSGELDKDLGRVVGARKPMK